LRAAVKPGGLYFMLCFRDEPPTPSGRVHRLAPDEIRTAFGDGWRVDAIEPITIDSALPANTDNIRGWRTAITRNWKPPQGGPTPARNPSAPATTAPPCGSER